jgi:hypothetical protein
MKSNVEGWNWKKKSIKKRIQNKINCNQKNEDQIWYKNLMKPNLEGWNWKKNIKNPK